MEHYPVSVKKFYRMIVLFDELMKSQQQGIDFLRESGVHYKEIEQKQIFLNAIKESMIMANEAIIDLMSALTRKDAMEDLFITELIRQRDYHAAWEYFWMNKALPYLKRKPRQYKKAA